MAQERVGFDAYREGYTTLSLFPEYLSVPAAVGGIQVRLSEMD